MLKVLNLFAGLGGNRKLWNDVEVTAVELDEKIAAVYQESNPGDCVVIADANQYLLEHYQEFDFIFSSPPCQSNSKMIRGGRNRKPRFADLSLYQHVLFLQYNFKGKWCVENVVPYYEPLIKPTAKIGRHLLWSNYEIGEMEDVPAFKGFIGRQNLNNKKELMDWLGIHYEQNIYYENNHCPTQILRNCLHPKVGEHILNELRKSN